ncbi:conserved hypothetical protein [Ahrensia sp. R2A130]|nr:conserved hypothetical protein [Ahrensia sp. R2A130]
MPEKNITSAQAIYIAPKEVKPFSTDLYKFTKNKGIESKAPHDPMIA